MSEQPPLVLVVDDQDAARFAKAQTLRRAGLEVLEAATGQAGLVLAAGRPPDVVVLDVNLPDISGFEVARRLKNEQGDLPGIPILQISSTAVSTADRVHGLELGADVYLTEPIAGEILVATVRALLRVRRAEQALAGALARERDARYVAEEASRLKDEFIATLSHELRTPLNALMGWIYQLRHTNLDEQARARALDSLERNARVQAQLINDLLDISRISKGKLHLRMHLVDLRSVLGDAVDSVRQTAARKHLVLSLNASTACWVVGDPARLQQVVTNLLTNAIQFTPERGRIAVELAAADSVAHVTVTDSGAGIAAEFLPHVFDQFRQGEAGLTRKHGGLGLGLSVVRQLVELHGGSVHVASPGLGAGATFTLLLPLEVDGPLAGASDPAQPVLTGLRALVVHRSAADLAAILEASGAESTLASSTAEGAAAAAAGEHFDVVVAEAVFDLDGIAPFVSVRDISDPGQLVRSVMHAVRAAHPDPSER